MWDLAAGTPPAGEQDDVRQPQPHRQLQQPQPQPDYLRRSRSYSHSTPERQRQKRLSCVNAADDYSYFQNLVGGPFNALGIVGLQYYEDIHFQRKPVAGSPSSTSSLPSLSEASETSSSSLSSSSSSASSSTTSLEESIFEPPPRNPLRLLQRRPSHIASCLVSTLYETTATITSVNGDGDSSSTTFSFKLASRYALGRQALDQISPPSSPDVGAVQGEFVTELVSPIDDDADYFKLNRLELKRDRKAQLSNSRHQQSSCAPTLHHHNNNNQPRPEMATSFGNYSAAPQGSLSRSDRIPLGSISENKTSHRPSGSFSQRLRLFGRGNPEPASGQSRPEQPFCNDLYVSPLNIPRKKSKPLGRSRMISYPLPPISASPESSPLVAEFTDRDLLLPSKFMSSEPRSAAQTVDYSTPQSQTMVQSTRARSPYGLFPANSTREIRRKPLHPSPAYEEDKVPREAASTSVVTPTRPGTHETWAQLTFQQQPNAEQWASYVVDHINPIAEQHSPPAYSLSPTHQDATVSGASPFNQPPHDGDNGEPKSIGLSRSASVLTTKPLPLSPPELSPPTDRVSQLSVRMSGLEHRRHNIKKSIKKMLELMPKDDLLASEEVLQKREMDMQKVEGLKLELADIQRQEYELGLKLRRAYKRQEKAAQYEPTPLWVRRIIS